jgi:hypothetical protein
VSPLWRDEVGAFLGPRKVALTRMRRGLRPSRVAAWRASLEQADLNEWSAALAALDEELARGEWQDANLRVAVSDRWVRYALVPWSTDLGNEEERLAHARLLMTSTYGSAVEQWTLGVSEYFPKAARIVSALPTQLLTALRERFAPHRLRLVSIQPQLIVAYNAWRPRLPLSGGWFVTIEEGSLAAIHWSGAGWDRVHSVRISDSWDAELRRLETFGRLAQGRAAEGRIFIHAPPALRAAATGVYPGLEWLDDERVAPANVERMVPARSVNA